MKTVNCFDDHAPKRDWLVSFFDMQDNFFAEHTLGPNMFTHFKRFLRDAGLIEKEKCTSFCNLICKIGWENDFALGLMLTNLAYDNAQFEWYIQNMDIGIYYDTNEIKEHLLAAEMKERAAKSIVKSFSRIVGTPFGTALNFGFVDGNDMVRTKCHMSDKRVFLYALYRFVERCNLNCEFNVSYLLDESVERDGVSPVRLFGIYEEEELRTILLGLSARYPEFINATFTNDLQSISLRDKTAADVLTPPLRLRYATNIDTGALPVVTTTNFVKTMDVLKSKDISWHFYAVLALAKNDEEAQSFRNLIKKTIANAEYKNIIVVDALSTPLGLEAFEDYVNYSAMSMYYNGNNNQQSKDSARKAKEVLDRGWKDRIHDGSFIVWSYLNQDGEKATG